VAKFGGGSPPAIQIFETDIYTVVLARSASDIPSALTRVPPEKRPGINAAIFKQYDKWYPGWTFALCCFNNSQLAKARPLIWWYEPLDKDTLFFPAIDAHDGRPPDLKATVRVDHAIALGTHVLPRKGLVWHKVNYTDSSIASDVKKLLPEFVMGNIYLGPMQQGDFVFKVSDVRAGRFKMQRLAPPGARKV